jgi:ribonuclease BN (tRNA processing enzyme)
MKLTIVGCGDAFGSGGRLQTCYCVESGQGRLLIDCGATTLIGLERVGIDPNSIDTVLISHLHGDHFSGLVWWYLHALHVSKRRTALTVAGPVGLEKRFKQAAEALFPGSLRAEMPFELRFVEQVAGRAEPLGGFEVMAFEVSHPSGAVSHALRLEGAGRTIAFSGDTEWVEPLVACASRADLFLCECYAYDRPVRYHMNWLKLQGELPRLGAKRVVLTHMNADMLANLGNVAAPGVTLAEDGLTIEF